MDLFLEIFVCLFQIVLFQFVATPMLRKDTYLLVLNRNLSWVRKNPSVLLKFPAPKDKYHYFLGYILIVLNFAQIFFKIEYNFIWIIHIISSLGMGLQYFAVDLKIYLRLRKEIPKAERVASLAPRKLLDFISKRVITIFLILLITCYIFWGYHFISLSKLVEKNTMSLVLSTLGLSILLGALLFTVRKAPICDDFEIDDKYRKLEITVILILMFLLVIFRLFSLVRTIYFKDVYLLKELSNLDGLLFLMVFAVFLFLSKKILKNIPWIKL